jgi:hypothetical protein
MHSVSPPPTVLVGESIHQFILHPGRGVAHGEERGPLIMMGYSDLLCLNGKFAGGDLPVDGGEGLPGGGR